MAKSAHNRRISARDQQPTTKSFVAVDKTAFDPGLASLFASSLGPVQHPPKSRYQTLPEKRPIENHNEDADEEQNDEEVKSADSASEQSESEDDVEPAGDSISDEDESAPEDYESDNETKLAMLQESVLDSEQDRPNKKRKRPSKEDEVEDAYMRKLAREEIKEEEKRKKQKTAAPTQATDDTEPQQLEDSDEESYTIPKHETMEEPNKLEDLEKATRTVFLGNVSSDAVTTKSAKKILLRHLASFIPDLAEHDPPHKVESIRFRSTAFTSALPKKAAFAKKEIMDATTKSSNAYAVYSTTQAANAAVKRLNGTMVLNRHLRVDSVAHPSKVDHRRCVFVGNLGFVDDESNIKSDESSKKKSKPPGDAEEGLWVHFSKAGKVESVRVVRDPKTRVGKGFAYVQFENGNGVEAALQFNDQKFPPLLPRKLRVVRAKGMRHKSKKPTTAVPKPNSKSKGVYNARITDKQKSMQGRAAAMLGKAGAFKSAESFVFEGHRASSKQGTSGLKLGGKKKGSKKPTNRSARRAAAYRAADRRTK
ncbi:hypothetical protein CC78DRAFT_611299 [Lojkania enalia]|uniref:Nucleolar protein 12 n=1 Tax=Lojkania enalia TaxID=147567 RepID=A0A9P4TRG0_9PLEO|nr:hypothetical protein CC78DRAFT_611299 [Didymosphaeria enalia]